ncbi:MAG: hypothetical protein OSA84_09345 [Akkermansiaceae bacterium]|nr:hypothetical protein [Akkermansiaceae bacterium]
MLSAVSASALLIKPPATSSYDENKAAGLESFETSSFAADRFLSGTFQLPVIQKSKADLSETAPVFVSQDALTLSPHHRSEPNVESVLDLSFIQETSAYRTADRIKLKVSDEQASGIQAGLTQISAAYQQPAQATNSADCPSVTMSVEQRIKIDPSRVLEIVESEVAANPNCACEIVKISINASGADESLVADITEVAITSAPESIWMISQCAIVTPPVEPPNPLDLPPPLPPPPPPPVITDPNP